MGNFAQQSLPLSDNATLTIQRVNSSEIDIITVSMTNLSFHTLSILLIVLP